MKRFIAPLAIFIISFLVAACDDHTDSSISTQPDYSSASPAIHITDVAAAETLDVPTDGGMVLAPPGAIEYAYDAEEKRLVIRHTDVVFRDGAGPVSLRVDRQENILTIIEEQYGTEGRLRRYDLTAEIHDLPAGVYRVLVVEPYPAEEQLPLTFKLDLVAGSEGRFDRPQSAAFASLTM